MESCLPWSAAWDWLPLCGVNPVHHGSTVPPDPDGTRASAEAGFTLCPGRVLPSTVQAQHQQLFAPAPSQLQFSSLMRFAAPGGLFMDRCSSVSMQSSLRGADSHAVVGPKPVNPVVPAAVAQPRSVAFLDGEREPSDSPLLVSPDLYRCLIIRRLSAVRLSPWSRLAWLRCIHVHLHLARCSPLLAAALVSVIVFNLASALALARIIVLAAILVSAVLIIFVPDAPHRRHLLHHHRRRRHRRLPRLLLHLHHHLLLLLLRRRLRRHRRRRHRREGEFSGGNRVESGMKRF